MLPKKDLIILANLRANARETLTNMSKKTAIPISTIYDRLKSYENNIITKHTALIDFTKLGYNARVNILLKVDRAVRDEAKIFLSKHHNVNSVFKISNGYDFLVEGIFRHVKDVEDFIDAFQNKFKVEQSQTYYLIEEVRREAFMNDDKLIEIL